MSGIKGTSSKVSVIIVFIGLVLPIHTSALFFRNDIFIILKFE